MGKRPSSHIFLSSGSGRSTTHGREAPLGPEREGGQAIISLHKLPTMLCSEIHFGQNMLMQIRKGPGSGQV